MCRLGFFLLIRIPSVQKLKGLYFRYLINVLIMWRQAWDNLHGLRKDCGNFSALATELSQSPDKPVISMDKCKKDVTPVR